MRRFLAVSILVLTSAIVLAESDDNQRRPLLVAGQPGAGVRVLEGVEFDDDDLGDNGAAGRGSRSGQRDGGQRRDRKPDRESDREAQRDAEVEPEAEAEVVAETEDEPEATAPKPKAARSTTSTRKTWAMTSPAST